MCCKQMKYDLVLVYIVNAIIIYTNKVFYMYSIAA